MKLSPIGIIHSPHRQAAGAPVQVAYAGGFAGEVEIFPPFAAIRIGWCSHLGNGTKVRADDQFSAH